MLSIITLRAGLDCLPFIVLNLDCSYSTEIYDLVFLLPVQSFKQMIASCLVKDPSKRPAAKKLLKHSFFKQARSNDYIARTLLEGLPALGDRIKALKVRLIFLPTLVPFSHLIIFHIYLLSMILSLFPFTFSFHLQRKEEDMLAQKKMPDGQKEEISQVGIIHL